MLKEARNCDRSEQYFSRILPVPVEQLMLPIVVCPFHKLSNTTTVCKVAKSNVRFVNTVRFAALVAFLSFSRDGNRLVLIFILIPSSLYLSMALHGPPLSNSQILMVVFWSLIWIC